MFVFRTFSIEKMPIFNYKALRLKKMGVEICQNSKSLNIS